MSFFIGSGSSVFMQKKMLFSFLLFSSSSLSRSFIDALSLFHFLQRLSSFIHPSSGPATPPEIRTDLRSGSPTSPGMPRGRKKCRLDQSKIPWGGGRGHSTEIAFALLNQQPRIPFSVFLKNYLRFNQSGISESQGLGLPFLPG